MNDEPIPIPDRMDLVGQVLAMGMIPNVDTWQPSDKERAQVSWTDDEETIKRACFLLRINQYLATLGIENPHEHALLTIQPFHPYDPATLAGKITDIAKSSELAKKLSAGWVSVASLDLLCAYYGALEYCF